MDIEELKRLATDVGTHHSWSLDRVERLKAFREVATPAAILSLIAEVEGLRKQVDQLTMAADAEARFADEMKAERDAIRFAMDASVERAMDAAFEREIKRVSTVNYTSNEVCRAFYQELRAAILEQMKGEKE